MAQYRRAAQARGYSPRRVDQSNIQRMREDSERTARNMRERAEMEISERRRSLAQQKEDQAATRRMEEKNYQIDSENSRKQLEGLRLQAQRDARQAALDSEASNAIFKSISSFSNTAVQVLGEEKKQKDALEYERAVLDGMFETTDEETQQDLKENAALGAERHSTLVRASEQGGLDPYVESQIRVKEETQQVQLGLAQAAGYVKNGRFIEGARQRVEQYKAALPEGESASYEDVKVAIGEYYRGVVESLRVQGYPTSLAVKVMRGINDQAAALLKSYKDQYTNFNKEQTLAQNLAIFQDSTPEDLLIAFPGIYDKIVWHHGGDNAEAWKELTPAMTAVDPKTGKPIMDMAVIDQLPLTINGKETTFGEHFSNRKGQAVGIRAKVIQDRNRNQVQWEATNDKIETKAREELEEKLVRAVSANPTAANIAEAQRMFVEQTGGEVSSKLTNFGKYASIETAQRNNEAQRIMSKPDDQLTQQDVDAAEAVMPADQAKVIKQRYADNVGQYHTKEATKIISNATAAIKGTTTFGTTKAAAPGAQIAVSYMEGQIRKKAKLIYGNGQNGFTVEEALTKAADDETAIYLQQVTSGQFDTSPYARKALPGGRVEFPYLERRAGDVPAAEKAVREYRVLREQVKSLGLQEVINIPNSFITPERMEYIAQNYGTPGFQPAPLERAFQGMSAGAPLHEIYNRAFQAAGRPERFQAPEILQGVTFTSEQQRIINDATASYQAKLNAVNVASGNVQAYQRPSGMRAGSPFKKSFTGALTYDDNPKLYQDAGNAFASAGFKVTEHPDFGGVVMGVHANNSYHGYGEAFDITLIRGSRSEDIETTGRLKEVVRNLGLFDEVIGPGDGDPNHETHLHLGGLRRPITQQDIDQINSVLN